MHILSKLDIRLYAQCIIAYIVGIVQEISGGYRGNLLKFYSKEVRLSYRVYSSYSLISRSIFHKTTILDGSIFVCNGFCKILTVNLLDAAALKRLLRK